MPFKRQENVFDGQVCVEPRLSCWYGEHSYSYNPLLKHEATPIDKWPSILKQILSQIKTDPNVKQLFPCINLNSVLCNLYRNGPTNDYFTSNKSCEILSHVTLANVLMDPLKEHVKTKWVGMLIMNLNLVNSR